MSNISLIEFDSSGVEPLLQKQAVVSDSESGADKLNVSPDIMMFLSQQLFKYRAEAERHTQALQRQVENLSMEIETLKLERRSVDEKQS